MPRKLPAGSRRERAQATRARIRDSAKDLFLERGYGATTMADVGRRAGVAVQTVYFTFRTKAALFAEVVMAVAGGPDAATPPMERPWIAEARAAKDPRRSLAVIIEHGTEIHVRMAPLWRWVVGAAAEDPEFAARFAAVVEARRRGMLALFEGLERHGAFAPGIGAASAAHTFFLMANPEVFSLATSTLGWSVERYKAWLYETTLRSFRDPRSPAHLTQDLSFHRDLGR